MEFAVIFQVNKGGIIYYSKEEVDSLVTGRIIILPIFLIIC